jgi:hypothetical protein
MKICIFLHNSDILFALDIFFFFFFFCFFNYKRRQKLDIYWTKKLSLYHASYKIYYITFIGQKSWVCIMLLTRFIILNLLDKKIGFVSCLLQDLFYYI